MIEQQKISEHSYKVIIRPNPAMPWPLLKKIYLIFALFILMIAIILTTINLYLAIPFYGAEVALLGYALYITSLRSVYYEEILIDEDHIKLSFVQRKNIKDYNFVRQWTYFGYQKATRTRPSEISIHYKGKKILIGQRVNEADKKELINLLKTFQIRLV